MYEREKKMREIRFKLSGMVLKTEKELVLENESTKGKGVCGTQERRRERERERERVKREYQEIE